ncbi:MAG: hypothetical protein BWZ07_02777 [Alphaproteobacteria bacterium ADurb.BinA280]|nr:MAG: hypothetical protein BWZ07_02777 [Alphaproteobacteria bacterium ADurb.BinA280]
MLEQHQHDHADRAEHLDHHVVGEALGKRAMLDLTCGHLHQSQGMQMVGSRIARQVEHAGKLSKRIEQWRCRATENSVPVEVMLGAPHFDGATFVDGCPDGIGAGTDFLPAHAWPKRHTRRTIQKLGMPDRIKDQAFGVGEDDDATGRACLFVQRFQLGAGVLPQQQMLIPRVGELTQGAGRPIGL